MNLPGVVDGVRHNEEAAFDLPFEPTARLDAIEIAVEVDIQQRLRAKAALPRIRTLAAKPLIVEHQLSRVLLKITMVALRVACLNSGVVFRVGAIFGMDQRS